jgi:hypothetical protein
LPVTAAHSIVGVVVQREKLVEPKTTWLNSMSVSEVTSNFVKGGRPVAVHIPTRPGDSGHFLSCEGNRRLHEGEQKKTGGSSMHGENSEYNPPSRILPDQPSGKCTCRSGHCGLATV